MKATSIGESEVLTEAAPLKVASEPVAEHLAIHRFI